MTTTKRTALGPAIVIALATVVGLGAGCAEAPQEPPISDREIARAQEALTPFKQELKAALMAGLEEGPAAAIPVCRVEAGKIAEANSIHGIRMGRTSHKLRNPDNAPTPWMEPLLAQYLEPGAQPPFRAVRLEDGRLGYVEPIHVAPMCLSCHGPALDASLSAAIHELYPADQATGFKADDLRGLFWVELAATGQDPAG